MAKKVQKLNKGQMIIKLLAQGKDNAKILAKVETTLNSIHWYRSKFNRGKFA